MARFDPRTEFETLSDADRRLAARREEPARFARWEDDPPEEPCEECGGDCDLCDECGAPECVCGGCE